MNDSRGRGTSKIIIGSEISVCSTYKNTKLISLTDILPKAYRNAVVVDHPGFDIAFIVYNILFSGYHGKGSYDDSCHLGSCDGSFVVGELSRKHKAKFKAYGHIYISPVFVRWNDYTLSGCCHGYLYELLNCEVIQGSKASRITHHQFLRMVSYVLNMLVIPCVFWYIIKAYCAIGQGHPGRKGTQNNKYS